MQSGSEQQYQDDEMARTISLRRSDLAREIEDIMSRHGVQGFRVSSIALAPIAVPPTSAEPDPPVDPPPPPPPPEPEPPSPPIFGGCLISVRRWVVDEDHPEGGYYVWRCLDDLIFGTTNTSGGTSGVSPR